MHIEEKCTYPCENILTIYVKMEGVGNILLK